MSINLKKGQNLNLSKETTSTMFRVGLGWDLNQDSTIKNEIDIDVFGLITDASDKGVVDSEIRFYNNIDGTGKSSSTHYSGMSTLDSFKEAEKLAATSVLVNTLDNLTGAGDGDDETMFFNSLLLADDKKVKILVNIYEAKARKQLFGMVKNAYVSVYDSAGTVICRYDLAEDFSIETGVIVGEFYKVGGETKFKALGTGFEGDLNDLVTKFK